MDGHLGRWPSLGRAPSGSQRRRACKEGAEDRPVPGPGAPLFTHTCPEAPQGCGPLFLLAPRSPTCHLPAGGSDNCVPVPRDVGQQGRPAPGPGFGSEGSLPTLPHLTRTWMQGQATQAGAKDTENAFPGVSLLPRWRQPPANRLSEEHQRPCFRSRDVGLLLQQPRRPPRRQNLGYLQSVSRRRLS